MDSIKAHGGALGGPVRPSSTDPSGTTPHRSAQNRQATCHRSVRKVVNDVFRHGLTFAVCALPTFSF